MLRKTLALSLLVVMLFVFAPNFASATPIPGFSFGGRVISIFIPGVVCAGIGPIAILPNNISPPVFYIWSIATDLRSIWHILPGYKVMGTYSPTPLPLCFTTTIPPVPFPVFPILMMGSATP